jgi:hypothetical protein
MDAASQCIGTFPALNFAQCIIGIGERNRQKVVDSKPFDLGLFLKAWVSMDIVGYPTQEVQGDFEQKHYADGRRWAASMSKVWRAA